IVRDVLQQRDRIEAQMTQRPMHGNTKLQLLDVLIVLLAAFFNPTCRSLRLIEQLSQLPRFKGQLNGGRICRSTLSDALGRFDPQELVPLIEQLMRQIPSLRRIDSDLEAVCRQVLIADGSTFNLAADVAWALKTNQSTKHKCRLNLQLDLDSFTPADLSVSGSDEGSEAAAFMPQLKKNVIYIVDRNFVHFGFIGKVLKLDSDIVRRLRSDTNSETQRELRLDAKDVEAGVVSDRMGVLPGSGSGKGGGGKRKGRSRTTPPPQRQLREVVIIDPETDKPIRLLTSLLEVPASLIGHLYRLRWQIELFLRWLKVWAGMDHLISHNKNGITIQFYAAMIACLLMHIRTGRKVDKYMLFLMGQVAAGEASMADIWPLLEKVDREKALARARYQRRKRLKTGA